jgi:Fe-S-cluster containining protein
MDEQERFFEELRDALEPIPRLFLDDYRFLTEEMQRSGEPIFSHIKRCYDFIDRYRKGYIDSFAVCKPGCAACCKIDVSLTTAEAEYIAISYRLHMDSGTNQTSSHRTPCPFLGSDDRCRIYEARPLNCRTFHAVTNPGKCSPDEPNLFYGYSGKGYGDPIFAHMATMFWKNFNSAMPHRDIRDFFPLN